MAGPLKYYLGLVITSFLLLGSPLLAESSLTGYELVGTIDGGSGFKEGKNGVVMLKANGKKDTLVVAVGSVIPGTAYTVANIEDGKAVVKDRSGRSFSIAQDPFANGSSSSSSAASVVDASSSDDMSDIATFHEGTEPEEVANMGQNGNDVVTTGNAPEPVVDTPHYSVQPGQEEEFLKRRQAMLERAGAEAFGNDSQLSNPNIPTLTAPAEGSEQKINPAENEQLPAFERIRRRADRTGLMDRVRRFRESEEADSRVPRG